MANTNIVVQEIAPLGGATNAGVRLGWFSTVAKAAQNDTFTVTNAKAVNIAFLQIIATGAAEPYTVSGNVVTMTSATATAVEGLVVFQ